MKADRETFISNHSFSGALAEQLVQDLPKHLNKFRETVVFYAHAAVDRLWDLKTLAEERFANTQEKKPEKPKSRFAFLVLDKNYKFQF